MMPLDYVDHFNLRAAPFGQAPSSEFFFAASQHEQILDELYHVAHTMSGLAVLTGDVGWGKTTMLRQLQSMLAAETYQVVTWVMHQPCSQPLDLLKALSQRLAIRVTTADPEGLLWNIQRYVQSLHFQQRRLILLVDEAQMLEGAPVMESLRALLNLEGDGYKLVSIVLAGLDGLVGKLAVDPALTARVASHGSLMPFTSQESSAYVQHRLDKAGASDSIFGDQVLQRVHALAEGVPRLINTLCDNMLVRLARLGDAEASLGLLDDVAQRLQMSLPSASLRAPAAKAVAVPIEAPRVRQDLLGQADTIAARLAHGSSDLAEEVTPPLGIKLPAETTVDFPGDSWPGISAAGDFLGNQTPPEGLNVPRSVARTDDDVVISILGEAQRRFNS